MASQIGIIRVLTHPDPDVVNLHGKVLEERFGLPTLSDCIPDQPRGIYDAETEASAMPKIVALAQQLVSRGAKGLLISCAVDPGLDEVRKAVSVPVVGAGSAGAAAASAFGGRFGILSLTNEVPAPMARILGDRVVALEVPEGVCNTTDLMAPGGVERSLESARKLLRQGADTILLGCTGYVTIGLAPRIQAELGVTAIDPVLAGGLMLSYALK